MFVAARGTAPSWQARCGIQDAAGTIVPPNRWTTVVGSGEEVPRATLNAAAGGGASAKVRALAATGNGREGQGGGSPEGKGDCRFFLKAAGCGRGAKWPFRHDLSSLTKQQRARKCLACGSEEHRQKDCPTKSSSPMRARSGANGGGKPAEEKSDPQVQTQTVDESTLATAGSGGAPSVTSEASREAIGKPGPASARCLGCDTYVFEGVEGD